MESKTNKSDYKAVELYASEYVPAVHRIGRFTTALAFVVAFIPVIYLMLFKGLKAPANVYVDLMIAVIAYNIGAWIINPCAHFTVLGAASTYMSYLAGNVANMRIPVAMSVQYSTDSDLNTPKGQLITTIGVAATVVINLVIVFICVMAGSAILAVMPQAVLNSFKYITGTLFGAMLMMKINTDFKNSIKYIPIAIVVFIVSRFVPFVKSYANAFAIVLPVLFAYCLFRKDSKDAPKTDEAVDLD